MRILIVGSGQVGSSLVGALHTEHELTVVDLDGERLRELAYTFDIKTVEANGASRAALLSAGLANIDLFIACTSRDEVNLVACSFARADNPRATTVIRTSNAEYVDLWRAGKLDADFAVSSELETAHAVTRTIGVPAARMTDVFAEGQVQVVEFEVDEDASPELLNRPLRETRLPEESRVASIIRNGSPLVLSGDERIQLGDLLVVIGSPKAAREWSRLIWGSGQDVRDVVVYGGGHVGAAIVRRLCREGISVRLIEPDRARAREVAEAIPDCRVFNTDGLDAAFLERERIGDADAAVFAMREDARNLFAAMLTRVHGVEFTVAIVHDLIASEVYEQAGIDVSINPRQVTAEEIARFAHDPRTQQVAMLEGDRFEILDLTTRPDSEYVGLRFREMPIRGALIGAIVRDGRALFPRSDDVLLVGDRVIVFTETSRVPDVEKVL
ncbi:MAG: Trk system potassium transporter TrkA [Gaiellales bacterium]